MSENFSYELDELELETSEISVKLLIDNILQLQDGNSLSFGEFEEFVLKNFKDEEIQVFRFGQKQRVSDVENLLESIASYANVDIAVGLELNLGMDSYFRWSTAMSNSC